MKERPSKVIFILLALMLLAGPASGARAQSRTRDKADPAKLEASLSLVRTARARFDFAGALRQLDDLSRRNGATAALLAEYGMLYLAAEEPRRSLAYFDRALKLESDHAEAVIGRAGVDLLQRDYASAELRLRQYLARNPQNNHARTMLAQVHLENNRNGEAATEAQRAVAIDARDSDALYVLAFIRASERKPGEARSLAHRAIAIDPFKAGARRLLSQYLNGRAGYEQRVPEQALSHYERGQALKRDGKLSEAVAEFEAALRVEPRYYRALIALGDIWLREEDYERAAAAAQMALDVDPEGALAHLELSYAHQGMRERARIEIGATDFASLFYSRTRPPTFELTSRIFPNYGSLSRRQQIVIDAAVAPLADYLPKLEENRARHMLLAFDQRVVEVSELDDTKDRRTFDGRFYASVRGVGGRITVSGIEYLDMAARGGFNTIAHEFAHQVHMTAMSRDEVKAIRNLYERAVRERRTLDYYAAANEYEYFAQGYEAFISEHKRPAAGVTARHTNRELMMRDPQLYQFLTQLTSRSRARSREAAPALRRAAR